MFSNLFVIALVIIFLVIFVFYKRQMIVKMFSLNVASSTGQFQEQIEETAEFVIQRLEEKIRHLEELLAEADIKIAKLDARITMTEKVATKKTETGILFHKLSNFSENNKRDNKDEGPAHHLNSLQAASNTGIDQDKEAARIHKRNSVLALAKEGYSSIEIAKNTGISKSEIMLLLQLNKNR